MEESYLPCRFDSLNDRPEKIQWRFGGKFLRAEIESYDPGSETVKYRVGETEQYPDFEESLEDVNEEFWVVEVGEDDGTVNGDLAKAERLMEKLEDSYQSKITQDKGDLGVLAASSQSSHNLGL